MVRIYILLTKNAQMIGVWRASVRMVFPMVQNTSFTFAYEIKKKTDVCKMLNQCPYVNCIIIEAVINNFNLRTWNF